MEKRTPMDHDHINQPTAGPTSRSTPSSARLQRSVRRSAPPAGILRTFWVSLMAKIVTYGQHRHLCSGFDQTTGDSFDGSSGTRLRTEFGSCVIDVKIDRSPGDV